MRSLQRIRWICSQSTPAFFGDHSPAFAQLDMCTALAAGLMRRVVKCFPTTWGAYLVIYIKSPILAWQCCEVESFLRVIFHQFKIFWDERFSEAQIRKRDWGRSRWNYSKQLSKQRKLKFEFKSNYYRVIQSRSNQHNIWHLHTTCTYKFGLLL